MMEENNGNESTDGSEVQISTDHLYLTQDSDGQIIFVVHPDQQFGNNDDGQVVYIETPGNIENASGIIPDASNIQVISGDTADAMSVKIVPECATVTTETVVPEAESTGSLGTTELEINEVVNQDASSAEIVNERQHETVNISNSEQIPQVGVLDKANDRSLNLEENEVKELESSSNVVLTQSKSNLSDTEKVHEKVLENLSQKSVLVSPVSECKPSEDDSISKPSLSVEPTVSDGTESSISQKNGDDRRSNTSENDKMLNISEKVSQNVTSHKNLLSCKSNDADQSCGGLGKKSSVHDEKVDFPVGTSSLQMKFSIPAAAAAVEKKNASCESKSTSVVTDDSLSIEKDSKGRVDKNENAEMEPVDKKSDVGSSSGDGRQSSSRNERPIIYESPQKKTVNVKPMPDSGPFVLHDDDFEMDQGVNEILLNGNKMLPEQSKTANGNTKPLISPSSIGAKDTNHTNGNINCNIFDKIQTEMSGCLTKSDGDEHVEKEQSSAIPSGETDSPKKDDNAASGSCRRSQRAKRAPEKFTDIVDSPPPQKVKPNNYQLKGNVLSFERTPKKKEVKVKVGKLPCKMYIRYQQTPTYTQSSIYRCDTCHFTTTRLENIVIHHKEHLKEKKEFPASESRKEFGISQNVNDSAHEGENKILKEDNSVEQHVR